MSHTSNSTEAAVIRKAQAWLAAAADALRGADQVIGETGGAVTVRIVNPRIAAALAEIDTAAVVLAGDAARLALAEATE